MSTEVTTKVIEVCYVLVPVVLLYVGISLSEKRKKANLK